MTEFLIMMLWTTGGMCALLIVGALFEFGISSLEKKLKRKKYRKYRYNFKR